MPPRRHGSAPVRAAGWAALVLALLLATRALAYALQDSPLTVAAHLRGELGGPRPLLVAAVAVGLAVALSSAIVWLAAVGARERWTLAGLPASSRPRVPVRLLLLRGAGLWVVTVTSFALLESYIHWRAGLGFHGLHCVVGPVHRDVLPIAGALSLLGASVVTAAGHLWHWMRCRLGEAYRCRPRAAGDVVPPPLTPRGFLPAHVLRSSLGARGPPLLAGC